MPESAVAPWVVMLAKAGRLQPDTLIGLPAGELRELLLQARAAGFRSAELRAMAAGHQL